MPIRLVLAEDHYLVREGLRRLLETQPELEVVAACSDLDSLLTAVEAEQPDVVVTDIRMPPGRTDEGIQAAERLRETHPDVGVVVLSQFSEPRYALALLEGGTAGRAYLLKERVEDIEQLVGAIRAVAAGGSAIDPKVIETLVADKARSEASPLHQLTPRERTTSPASPGSCSDGTWRNTTSSTHSSRSARTIRARNRARGAADVAARAAGAIPPSVGYAATPALYFVFK